MIMKEILINSEELHIITGLPVSECRKFFNDFYFKSRTSFDVIEKHAVPNIRQLYEIFKRDWFKYHENRAYITHAPFEKEGEFKIKRKAKFIIDHIDRDQSDLIQSIWETKRKQLQNQTSFN